VLVGGFGRDTLTGGAGADSFVFGHRPGVLQADLVVDFTPGEDVITLKAAAFTGLDLGLLSDDQVATVGNVTLQTRIIYVRDNGWLLYDVDGVDGANAIILMQMALGLDLRGADFNVI
jgi:Ca2+-binding RTX toxin-like protein